MRTITTIFAFIFLSLSNIAAQSLETANIRSATSNSIPSDNTLRYYRLAIPVTHSAYVEDLNEDYNNVLQFWRECEDFVNEMFAPLGFCFNVIEDQRLIKSNYFPNEDSESFIYTLQSNGTSNTNDLIGEDSYDVGMWVHHREVELDNSGLSAEGGVYSSIAKGSGYSKTDKWVVAHELGHMFGAPHTTTGEGSLMDSGGDDFFSYPSIKKIRELAVEKGAESANNAIKVSNNAPVFINESMNDFYKIPQGACMAIPVYVNDADNDILTYSAIGCSSSTVGNIVEGGVMPHFASVIPQKNNIIDYRPKFTADIFYNDFYYEQDGTNIPAMNAGSYNIAILVNDVPASTEYDYLTANPFYSDYAVWDATVQIVGGTAFNASMSPAKDCYSAGEQVTIIWGVNNNYFTADSRLRITMSTDYGKTFNYILADNVPALDGNKVVTLPNVNVENINVDFKTATRSMRGGIIRVEEVGGVAYTLTTLSPENGGGFNINGGGSTPEPVQYIVTTKANPAEGGTAQISTGSNQSSTSATVTNGTSVTLYAVANTGYRFVSWTNGANTISNEAATNVTITANSEFVANFEKENTTIGYPAPTGTTYTNNYLTSITTTGGDTNVSYSTSEHPEQLLVVVPGKVQIEKGESFTINLVANSLGAGDATTVYEDMRYNHASLFTDFDQDYIFQETAAQTWGDNPPAHNIYGNYDYVMNITHTITVPDDAPIGESHIRMIYTNAWKTFPVNGTATLDKGIVYDIIVDVVENVDISVSASEGGSVTINGESTNTKEVTKGTNITLAANSNNGYIFCGWYDGEDMVSDENPYTFTATSDIAYTAHFAQDGIFPDGAYKIHWQQNGRGYLAYHTSYPAEAKLADVTLGNYGNSHFTSTSPEVNIIWYLITADDGNRYLFHAATGKFITAGTAEAGKNAKANVLSTTETLPIRIEENTVHSGYYVLMATVNGTDALLSSGCGTPSTSGNPVRWWYDNNNKDFMSDGGSPLTLIPVKDVVVEESIMAAVRAIINGTEESVLTTGYYRFKCIGGGKYLSSEVSASNGNRLVMDGKENIFYYNQSSLLSYARGQYIGISQTANIYDVTLSDIATSPIATEVIPSAGVYYISLGGMNDYGNGIRYIYGNADEADSGTQDTGLPTNDGYKWAVEEITELPVEIGKTGWATIYAPVALELPIGVTAYYIEKENIKEDYITLTAITDNVIPALTGVILYSKEAVGNGKSYDFTITESSATYDTNILEGSIAKEIIYSEAFVLSELNGLTGFYKAQMNLSDNKAFLNNCHKAYLPIAKITSADKSNGWHIIIDGENSTSIDEIHNDINDNEIYDLTGRRINTVYRKGIYISNGQKIYVH
ncbi:MAG: InlB B-repeat-containing protein [Bacteroidaceae bacterium]|nr:InlB B-repeat-containing protein [Bacteroidaceae bacterium]